MRRAKRHRACYQHRMVRASLVGWFVCQCCGMPAVCPGCVVVVPEGAQLHLCRDHQQCADASVGRDVVWATKESSR
jgi:hypothetical protein